MTVTTNTNKVQALGNGATKTFPYSFRIYSSSDLVVTSTDIETGTDTELVLNTDYTVTGAGSYNGGNVVLSGTAPSATTRITIRRVIPVTQVTDLRNQGAYFAETHEDVFDRLTMIGQQHQETLDRSLTLSPTAPDVSTSLPVPVGSRVIGWNEAGDALQNYGPVDNTLLAVQLAASGGAAMIGHDGSTLSDILKSSVGKVLSTIAALRAVDSAKYTQACVTGYYAAGDGGGGVYYCDAADTTTADNGGTVIVATDGARWKLIWSGYLSVKQFGAKGDYNLSTFTGTNDQTALQACATVLAAAGGGEMYHPPGNYYTTGQILFTGPNNDFVRVSVTGAGSGASQIVGNAGGNAVYKFQGGTGDGVHSYQHIKGLHFRAVGGTYVGTAIALDNFAYGEFDDLVIENFEYAINGSDVLSTTLRRCVLRGNTYGLYAARTDFSHPNAVTIDACYISAQKIWGVFLGSPSALTIIGGSIEGNGTDSGTATRGGVLMLNPGTEGATGIHAAGVYFEGNGGVADFYSSSSGTGGQVAFSFAGCTFNRISATQYVTNNIRIEGEAKASVAVTGCGFKHFNTYVPDAGRPYLNIIFSDRDLVTFHEKGNMYASATEAPTRAREAITVGASPYTYTNNSGEDQVIHIVQGGGTASSVVYVRNNNGAEAPLSGLFTLSPTDALIVTYPGSAPTMLKYRM